MKKELTLTELRELPTISIEEASQVLGLSRTTTYELARRGDIPVVRFGRRFRVPGEGLAKLLTEPYRCASCHEQQSPPSCEGSDL